MDRLAPDGAASVRTVSSESARTAVSVHWSCDNDDGMGCEPSWEYPSQDDVVPCAFESEELSADIPGLGAEDVDTDQDFRSDVPVWDDLPAHACLLLDVGSMPPDAGRRDFLAARSSSQKRQKDVDVGACRRCPPGIIRESSGGSMPTVFSLPTARPCHAAVGPIAPEPMQDDVDTCGDSVQSDSSYRRFVDPAAAASVQFSQRWSSDRPSDSTHQATPQVAARTVLPPATICSPPVFRLVIDPTYFAPDRAFSSDNVFLS